MKLFIRSTQMSVNCYLPKNVKTSAIFRSCNPQKLYNSSFCSNKHLLCPVKFIRFMRVNLSNVSFSSCTTI